MNERNESGIFSFFEDIKNRKKIKCREDKRKYKALTYIYIYIKKWRNKIVS